MATHYHARDRTVLKNSRDGLQKENIHTKESVSISKKEQDMRMNAAGDRTDLSGGNAGISSSTSHIVSRKQLKYLGSIEERISENTGAAQSGDVLRETRIAESGGVLQETSNVERRSILQEAGIAEPGDVVQETGIAEPGGILQETSIADSEGILQETGIAEPGTKSNDVISVRSDEVKHEMLRENPHYRILLHSLGNFSQYSGEDLDRTAEQVFKGVEHRGQGF